MKSRKPSREVIDTHAGVADVIDLAARRRCHYERRGLDPVAKAVRVLADTGRTGYWDDSYDGDGDWAA
ncbi:hypothetical protein ACWDYH_01910 [Nocardia goodfellowii]